MINFRKKWSDIMKSRKNPLVNEDEMKIRANLNNLEPGDSVNEHRVMETGNLIQAHDEIQQQNNNL